MKQLLIIPLLLILVGYMASGCSSSNSEKAKNDSIAAAEIEAARLDSIRQDSINRRNFTTPDLAFYDLHGDVKNCVIGDSCKRGTVHITYRFPQWDISFNEAGEIINLKDPNYYQRNESGDIIGWRGYEDVNYEWDNERLISFTYGDHEVYFKYDENGFLLSADDYEYSDEIHYHDSYVFSDYEVDEVGNWVSRQVNIIKKLHFISTNGNSTYFDDGFETRLINYHKSNGGKTHYNNNNNAQSQELDRVTKSQKEAEDEIYKHKHPENVFNKMINDYAWVCTGTMDTYQGQTHRVEEVEQILIFYPLDENSGRAARIRWADNRKTYYPQFSTTSAKYKIQSNFVYLSNYSNSMMERDEELPFLIDYDNGMLLLRYATNIYRPIPKTDDLIPANLNY